MDHIRSRWGEVDKPKTSPGNGGNPQDVPQLISGTLDSDTGDDNVFEMNYSWSTVPVTVNYKSTHGNPKARFPSSSSGSATSFFGSSLSGSGPNSPVPPTAVPTSVHLLPSLQQQWHVEPAPQPRTEGLLNPTSLFPPLTRKHLGDAAFPLLTPPAEPSARRTAEEPDVYASLSHLWMGRRNYRNTGWSDSDSEEERVEEKIPMILTTQPSPPPGFPLVPQYEPLHFPDVSRDETFHLDQVTPTSFLSSERYASLRPKSFRVELPNDNQMAHTDVYFFLVAKDSASLLEPRHFSVIVTSPSGFLPSVPVYADRRNTDRYVCTFHAVESGPYEISVCLGLQGRHHVDGSPCRVIISRNYAATPRRAIMSRILSPAPYDEDAPGLRISENSKIWGITDNPVTEEIFAADRDAHVILRFSTQTGVLALKDKFGVCVPVDGKEFKPTGIDFDPTNQLLVVTDKDNHRVCIFQSNGTLVRTFGSFGYQNGQFSYPWGVAVSPNGKFIVIADSHNHRLQLFTQNGEFLRKYTVFETNPFEYKHHQTGLDFPRGICFDKSGKTIYVSDFNLRNVFAVNLEFTAKQPLCPMMRLVRPQGLAVDGAGNVLICDSRSGGGAVRVVRQDGVPIGNLEGPTNARTETAIDVTVCRGDYICVVDMLGTRIRIF